MDQFDENVQQLNLFLNILNTCNGPQKLMMLSAGANLTSYLVSSSVQFGLKSLFAKFSRLQIKAFSLHPDC